ncbi:DNA repair protein RadC [Lachnospiraceae bacterium KM106-2]|nr:DNA repair protein RadC [Lachnospiraceae bacterium KM106-2]
MNQGISMKEVPNEERPYEKCIKRGAESLSDAELLAIILRTGSKSEDVLKIATRIMQISKEYIGLLVINQLTMEDLLKINGIGNVKAVQLLALKEISRRMAKATREEGLRLLTPQSVANYYMEDMRHLTIEQILLVMMDSKSKILNDMVLSQGTVNASILAPREVFIHALRVGAVSIILLHNHPSGDPNPSREDIETTKRVKEAGLLIGIKLLDHIIIGDNQYISLKEKGLI